MNLQDEGFRFILRAKDGRIDGYWEHPATIKPGGFDATDIDDEKLAAVIYDMQDGHEPKVASNMEDRKLDPHRVQICRVAPIGYDNGQPCACKAGTCRLWKGGLRP